MPAYFSSNEDGQGLGEESLVNHIRHLIVRQYAKLVKLQALSALHSTHTETKVTTAHVPLLLADKIDQLSARLE